MEKTVLILLGLVVIVSGCIGGGEKITGGFTNSPTTGGESDFTFYNMNDAKKEQIQSIANNYYEKVPVEKSERLNTTAKVANEVCELEKIDKELFKEAADTKRQAYRLKHAAETIQNNFNSDIQPSKIHKVIEGAGKVGRYATVVGPYNQFVEDACDVNKTKPETVEEFYMSSASLGLELAMIQYSVYYKTSYEVTRVAANSRTYRAVQSQFGDDALRTLMSETHWAVRGTLQGADQFALEKAEELGIDGNMTIDTEEVRQELQQKYGVSVKGTLKDAEEVWRDAEPQKKISCIRDSINWKAASKVASIVSDGEVTNKELESLPSGTKKDVLKCVSS